MTSNADPCGMTDPDVFPQRKTNYHYAQQRGYNVRTNQTAPAERKKSYRARREEAVRKMREERLRERERKEQMKLVGYMKQKKTVVRESGQAMKKRVAYRRYPDCDCDIHYGARSDVKPDLPDEKYYPARTDELPVSEPKKEKRIQGLGLAEPQEMSMEEEIETQPFEYWSGIYKNRFNVPMQLGQSYGIKMVDSFKMNHSHGGFVRSEDSWDSIDFDVHDIKGLSNSVMEEVLSLWNAVPKLYKTKKRLMDYLEDQKEDSDSEIQKEYEKSIRKKDGRMAKIVGRYGIEREAMDLILGLGMDPEQSMIEIFTSEEKNKLVLVKTLLYNPDIIVLMEPSYRLLPDEKFWLADWLKRLQNQSWVVFSSDIEFLQALDPINRYGF